MGKEDTMNEKQLGNKAYQKKDFTTVISHY